MRQRAINGMAGAFMGYACGLFWTSGHPVIGILVFVVPIIMVLNNVIEE